MSLVSVEDHNNAIKKLKGAHVKALEFACSELDCTPAGKPSTVEASKHIHTKDDFTAALVEWVGSFLFLF